MADIDKTKPQDSDLVSQYPPNERDSRSAIETILAANHEAGSNTANDGKHTLVNLIAQSTPTAVSGEGLVYTKDVGGGQIEAFFMDAAGNEIQMTAGGFINPAAIDQGSGSGLDSDLWDGGHKTVSTSSPSGGADGDVHFEY